MRYILFKKQTCNGWLLKVIGIQIYVNDHHLCFKNQLIRIQKLHLLIINKRRLILFSLKSLYEEESEEEELFEDNHENEEAEESASNNEEPASNYEGPASKNEDSNNGNEELDCQGNNKHAGELDILGQIAKMLQVCQLSKKDISKKILAHKCHFFSKLWKPVQINCT